MKSIKLSEANMIIAGKIICSEDLSDSKIIVDIIHPTGDWEYCDLVGRKVLKSADKSFNFKTVFPGRITLLRVYEKKARSFRVGFSIAWRNWLHYIDSHYREIKWTRLRDIIYLFSFKKFFISIEVYHILPLLSYNDTIEVKISKENL
ncbi:MAG: hypothetical protein HC831_14805 [Chloroflexia bacterium]|nr:hypothetical protein [Chloroflexia bacterium]